MTLRAQILRQWATTAGRLCSILQTKYSGGACKLVSFIPPTIAPPTEELGVIASLRAVRRNVLSVLPDLSYTQPIVSGRTGPARWHMVQGAEGLKRVFLDNVGNYPKSAVMIRMLRPAVGASLFTSEDADWRWQRRAIAPVFSNRNVRALAPVMTATAERACTRIAGRDGPIELVREMLSATFDVICEVALSGREHFDAEAYGAAITRYFLTVGRASLLDFLEAPAWVPRPGEILGRGAVKTMHRMVARAIDARRAQATGRADDLLDYMLKAEDPDTGRRMEPTDLLHNMQFFIVAGHETTALALAWSLFLLAHDTEAQSRAHDQARAAIGTRPACADDLSHAPYVEQVLQEAMRLYPRWGSLPATCLPLTGSMTAKFAPTTPSYSTSTPCTAIVSGGRTPRPSIPTGSRPRNRPHATATSICHSALARASAWAQISRCCRPGSS
jgi:cytochrome P450